MGICGWADSGDFCIGDEGFGGIVYAAGDGGVCGLGTKNRRRRKEEEQQEGDSAHGLGPCFCRAPSRARTRQREIRTSEYSTLLCLASQVAQPLLAVRC